jgi:hypothetical protein
VTSNSETFIPKIEPAAHVLSLASLAHSILSMHFVPSAGDVGMDKRAKRKKVPGLILVGRKDYKQPKCRTQQQK